MQLAPVSLDDKYELETGRVYITGVQALVKLPLIQRQRDLAAGLNTGGYISGYRGSPLAAYDLQLWLAKKFLEKQHIVFQPGVNEDMAATALWGSQQLHLSPGAKYDGVFGIWYGKGPGVDRSGDVFRHANYAGTGAHGGVLALCGDDHNAISSTMPHQSDHNMMALMMPMLYPAGVQEYLDYGLLGWAMSRYSGLWIGYKCVSELVESSASISVDPHKLDIVTPEDFEMPLGGLNIRWPDDRWDQEERLVLHKTYAALAFARANKIDRTIIKSANPRIGLVATGKSYLDLRQAMADLGIDEGFASEIGLTLYKVGMTWPLEREGIRHFAEGLDEVIVVEEKRALIENQLKEQLYNWRADVRPRVVGKYDENGAVLLPAHGELSPSMIAKVLTARLDRYVTSRDMVERMAVLERKEAAMAARSQPGFTRPAYFCSGCPHNTSTKVPDGSRSLAGVGCHYMAVGMNRHTETFTQMGGEGVPWTGCAPFTAEKHIFANLGDGTYHHSGILAIRAAVASGVNITYKILYNDAVAMTGGQPILQDGQLTPWEISQQIFYEGVRKIIVTTDEPDKYPVGTNWAPGTKIQHRDDLDQIQRELRETPGCTVIIHDQTCAAEKRRRRKRGTYPDPDRRVFINDLVCEGCGDCSEQSNCVSVEPLETEFGRKRVINQSACNKDFSCLKGFCPSFVTVSGASIRKARAEGTETLIDAVADLPLPDVADSATPYNILVTGIGGTGVITIGALLGMAAHLEGKGVTVLDFTGLAQKNGEVMSHVRIAQEPEDLHSVRIPAGTANLLIGCDMIVAAADASLRKLEPGMTHAIVNGHLQPTADFTLDTDISYDTERMHRLLHQAVGDNLLDFIDATKLATALTGDAIATNLFLMGYAGQRGLLPVSLDAIERAIDLNGVAVEMNKSAFAFGRLAAHDLDKVADAASASSPTVETGQDQTLQQRIERRTAYLSQYQDAGYAAKYSDFVHQVEATERNRARGLDGLTDAVADGLFKLMSYKDEYEVARLYTDGTFEQKLKAQFDGELEISLHLAPPIISKRDASGRLKKREFGPWMFRAMKLLARMKGLRGGPLDIFGRSEERRMERRLIGEYRAVIEELLATLDTDNHRLAVEIAKLPQKIRGFGHIKEANAKRTKAEETELLVAWRNPSDRVSAAE